ncbi:MAG: TetR/AcrR family transcriptional regulator [Streptosporangiaceae bacterium]|nr:TetR/AcrR family transcriptional regulator [Streptosporangiaceae bacterium]MBV9855516.1 TetR/AcrR family transcriptional regulator [Streptosporangiaceae bacterium]
MLETVSARKHAAIASVALTLFVRQGYERTSVDAIAAGAEVSKRTVYSHYGGKESLFFFVVRRTFEALRGQIQEIVERTPWDGDVREALTACIREIALVITRSPERAALIRLVVAEAPHFPELLDLWRGRGITPLLAQPLAGLAAAGRLDAADPMEAAEHLSALTFGQISNKSLMGTVRLTEEEVDRFIVGGIRVFLRAYAPADP